MPTATISGLIGKVASAAGDVTAGPDLLTWPASAGSWCFMSDKMCRLCLDGDIQITPQSLMIMQSNSHECGLHDDFIRQTGWLLGHEFVRMLRCDWVKLQFNEFT